MSEVMKIGSRIRLKEEVNLFSKVFPKGHEFKIYGSSYRGFDLVDDDGQKMDECAFIHDKFELISLVDIRDGKIDKLIS